MDIVVCCPSYKRDEVKSFRFFGKLLKVYVCETEYDRYIEKNPEYADCFVRVPKGVQGNVARIRNYILNDNKDKDVCCLVDDDISYIGYYEGLKLKKLNHSAIVNIHRFPQRVLY